MDPLTKQSKPVAQSEQNANKPEVRAVVGVAKKEKKKGSSRGARRLEDIESRVSKSVRRVARAVDKGVDTYIERRDKSANKRRDGALVDFGKNVARGVSETIADSTPVITDLAKALTTKRLRKGIRKAASAFGRIPLIG